MKRRLKYQYLLIFIGAAFIIPLLTIATLVRTNLNDVVVEEPDYVTEEVIENSMPVVNTKTIIINPYVNQSVTVGKNYYDYQAEAEKQINSILKHENTYIQNTGIDYVCDAAFEVVSILDGTVINVTEEESTGKAVEIKHENGLISIYQSLSEVNIKKGDVVVQGQVLGMSGTNELDKDLGNHLHFEIYENGSSVNPENYLNKEISQEKGN